MIREMATQNTSSNTTHVTIKHINDNFLTSELLYSCSIQKPGQEYQSLF